MSMRRDAPDAPVPIGFHVMMRIRDRRVVVGDERSRRVASRVLLGQGEHRGLIAHGAADNHLHSALLTHRDAAGRFAHDAETSLRQQLGLAAHFEPALIKPIESQAHLVSLFWYVHRQEEHHGTDLDRAHDGSSLPDIIGGRVVLATCGPRCVRRIAPAIGARVARALPRVRGRELLALLGGPELLTFPVTVDDLAAAAAAAVGAPDLEGDGAIRSAALCAAVHAVSHPAGGELIRMTSRALSDALGVTMRSVQRYREREPVRGTVQAVAFQWRLRSFLRDRAASEGGRLLALSDPALIVPESGWRSVDAWRRALPRGASAR
jgi:hypothetical protein